MSTPPPCPPCRKGPEVMIVIERINSAGEAAQLPHIVKIPCNSEMQAVSTFADAVSAADNVKQSAQYDEPEIQMGTTVD